MAFYRASTTGNWSNLAIWQIWNGSAWVSASVLPGAADDVWSNNFTVTINQDITVLTLRNAANTTPVVTAGGHFSISSNVSVTCVDTIISTHIWQNASSLYLIQTSGSANTITLNMNLLAPVSGSVNFRYVLITHTGILNYNGTIRGSINSIPMLFINSVLTVNIVGSITNYNNSTGGIGAVHIAQNATVNITGDLFVENILLIQSNSFALTIASICTVNITGNISNFSTNSTIGFATISIVAAATLNIIGNVTGGVSNPSNNAIVSSSTSYINHIGTLIGGNASSAGTGGAGIVTTNASSITILSGPFVFGNYGSPPFNCVRVFFSNNTSKYIEFASNSTNGALFPSPAPTRSTMYSPNTLADSPIPVNVRQGTVYALGSQTGTLAVPSPSDVRKGLAVDNTVGTAELTAEDILNAIETSSNDVAVRLRNVATVASTGGQLASYNI